MAKELRVVGFDDSPHTRSDGRVPVVGVVMRTASYIDGFVTTDVLRDGGDSTNRIARCVVDSGFKGLHAILLDGASFAGFNVVDLDGLHEETGVPCLAFTKGVPDLAAMRRALDHVPDAEGKWALLERRRRVTMQTATSPITVSFAGMGEDEAAAILASTTLRGLVPEPLRLAHMVASLVR